MNKVYFIFMLVSICFGALQAEIQEIILRWDAATCREECIPYLDSQIKAIPGVSQYEINSKTGVAQISWKPTTEFSYGYFNLASRMAGPRILDFRIKVRGTVLQGENGIFLASLGDNTRFLLIGPLKTDPHQYTINANLANHPLPERWKKRLLESARRQELITVEGTLFEPTRYIATIVVEQISYPKDAAKGTE